MSGPPKVVSVSIVCHIAWLTWRADVMASLAGGEAKALGVAWVPLAVHQALAEAHALLLLCPVLFYWQVMR